MVNESSQQFLAELIKYEKNKSRLMEEVNVVACTSLESYDVLLLLVSI
jgi:hypothetical protein